MKQGILSAVFLSLALAFITNAAPIQVANLRVDLQSAPTGVSTTPRLSWTLTSEERGKRQYGYHILAASTPDKLTPQAADLWNSDLQKKSSKHLIPWGGKTLKDGQTIHWKVQVLDEDEKLGDWSKPASFTVGGKKTLQKPARISSFESNSEALNSLYTESLAHLETRLANFSQGGNGNLGTGAAVQRSARAFLYHFDAIPHLTEWLRQMDESMTKEDYFPIQPGSKSLGSLSSESGITVNHPLWWMGGDSKLAAQRWSNFEKHMKAREKADPSFKGSSWGDLKATADLPAEFLDLCSLGFATRLARELALPAQQPLNVILFKDYTSRIQKNFEKQYLNEDGSLKLKSQTAQLLALRCAVLKPENQKPIIASLLASIDKNGPQVGPLGAFFLPSVLSLTQHQDKAVKILTELTDEQKKAFIGNGISEWLMSFLAGIDASAAGFEHVMIAPRIPKSDSVKWVQASHDSVVGKIAVRWEKLAEGALKFEITIPAGSIARIVLPCTKDQSISENGKPLKDAQYVDQASRSDSAISLISQSGSYSFLIK